MSFWEQFMPDGGKQFRDTTKRINDQLEKQGEDPLNWDDPTGKEISKEDYKRAAERSSKSNADALDKQIKANRPTINTPFGNQSWTQDANGNWTLNSGLTGQMGGVATGLQGQVADAFGRPVMNGDMARDQAVQGAYGQATSRLDPRFAQRESQLRTQLMNQGLDPTSSAFQTEMGNFGRDRNDAYSSAMNGAIAQGTQAGQSVFDQNMQAQNAPLQRLLQMQNLLNTPNFNAAGNSGGTDYLGAFGMYGNYKTGQDQIAAQREGQAINGATNLAGSALP